MLWRTHIRITYRVLEKLGIPTSHREASHLREGLIAPDKWEDYPHHYGKSEGIQEHILKARRFFLHDDLPNVYFNLGVALHYVQDSYTSLTSRSGHHDGWEHQIEQSHFVDDLEKLVEWTFRERQERKEEYMELLEFLSAETEGKEDTLEVATLCCYEGSYGAPHVDLNFSFRASLLVVKSVFSSKYNAKLNEELRLALAKHELMLEEAETKFTDETVELIRKRDELEKRVTQRKSGVLATFKSYFWKLLGKIYNRRAKARFGDYEERKHLKSIARTYQKTAERISAPHVDWYEFAVPQIDVNIVEKKLLAIPEAASCFEICESDVRALVSKEKISCYCVSNKELIRRSELNMVLMS